MAIAERPSVQPPSTRLEELDQHDHQALKTRHEDLRNKHQTLEETLGRFTAFFQALPIAALIITGRGQIHETNPAAKALFNLPRASQPLVLFMALIAEERRSELLQALEESAEHKSMTLTDVQLLTLDGEPLIGDLHLAPLPGAAGAEPEYICTVVDRSESVHDRQRLQEQRAQLEAIFQAAPVGIVFVRARRMLQFNAAWSELIGYAPAELVQQDTRLLYADDAEYLRVDQALYGQMQREGSSRLETRFRHKSGHWLDVALCAAPIAQDSEDGAWVVTVLNISRRKTAEQALQEREERLRLTLAATNDGLWDLDLPSRRVVANERFSAMLGYAPGELELRLAPLRAMIHPEDQPRMRVRFTEHLRTGTPYALDIRMRCKDGSWRWLRTRGQVVARNTKGQPLRMVGTHTDIHALTESNRRLREAERLAVLGHWDYDTATSVSLWSRELYRIVGFDPRMPVPDVEDLAQLFHPDDAPEFLHKFHQALETGEPFSVTLRLGRRDGALRWLYVQGRTERDKTGRVLRCFGTAQDVTEREQAQQRLRETAQVFERTADGIIVAGADHRIIAVNPAFTQITGYDEDAVAGLAVEAVLSSSADQGFWERGPVPLSDGGDWPGERWEHRQDGSLYQARLSLTQIRDERDQLERYLIIISETTPLHRTRQQVEFLSQYDPLTGLGNRSHFRTRLAQLLQAAEQGAGRLAVLIVDLDRFRVVNESLGQLAADALLQQVASALSDAVHPMDTLARLGGDEFGVILPAIDAREPLTAVAERLQERCAEPRVVEGQSVTLTASVGVAVYPLDGGSEDVLMRHANIALKQAKARGRQRVQRFEHAAAQGPPDRLRLEACLSRALLNDELQLHYQPQVQLGNGQLMGAEALLRWHSAELGSVSPQQFIPIAEDMGLIDKIGTWVLRQAAQQLAAWDRAGQRLPRLAVNLSILQLEDPGLVPMIEVMLQQYSLDPSRLELELTESLLMRQADQAATRLDALRQLGVRLAIDDFGTGYSSLAYLHRLPLQQLKIDRSFVDPLPGDPHSQTITKAIIALGNSLGVEVLAEGIETAEQAVWLRDAGCRLAQGYHYGRPVAADAFAAAYL
ncbi:EAL domain-containing protein [Lamprobacter modestohalophilus]|uniref:bifunctional diguanylate cyclase/phosphodiesterase n=1 Tax=Lamprobacter modestohalophilus TaxID=1064514 RepID=UPI002ADEC339|nr:EAL domain-containing protein [Lamprobacter modestohalophilus]MEA1052962.1 EAL domain-containing protein [Lamprobacter modestohalophilus]